MILFLNFAKQKKNMKMNQHKNILKGSNSDMCMFFNHANRFQMPVTLSQPDVSNIKLTH